MNDFSKWDWNVSIANSLPGITLEQLYQLFKQRQEREQKEQVCPVKQP